MSDFYPEGSTIGRMRQAIAADSRYDWATKVAAQELPEPGPDDMAAVIAQFLALAGELGLSTGDVSFWVVVVPFANDGIVAMRQFGVFPDRPELCYAGPYPNVGEPLSTADAAANPGLANDVRNDFVRKLMFAPALGVNPPSS